MQYQEAMELYQAQYFLKDLKYYLTKNGKVIFPVRMSLEQINSRYLKIVKDLRASMKYRDSEHDRVLIELVAKIGFDINPALQVIGDVCSSQIDNS